ncbi:Phosphoacetylglucosamine Mutase [Podila verticillata]|nr:Phosphoacetylglucosamine Mutase [Podila verticillata]
MTGANNSLYLTPNVTNTDGLVEIKVGVLLPYSLPNDLTQQLTYSGTSAIRMAVSEINAKNIIPGAYITLVLKDSFNGADPENSGAGQAIFSTVSLLQTEGGVSGVIGDVSSALTVQSALLTSRLSIPQCSFSAGSTQLSSKEDYGHFFRTIPTELMFGRVMIDFVASRGWKTMAVFYTGDALGSEMMDSIAMQARKRNINIGYRHAFWTMGSSSDVGSALDGLKESGQQIVVVAAVGVPQIRLMVEAVRRGLVSKNYVWMTINQVTEPLLEIPTIKPADLNGLFMFDNMLKLHGYPPYEDFLDKWSEMNPAEYPYSGSRDISSNEAQAYSCMMVLANGFANAVKGNWTALHLLASGRLGAKLRPINMNTNYTGPGGPMLFDDYGDVVYGNFILYNYQNGRALAVGTSYSGVFNVSSPPMYFDGTYIAPSDSAPLTVLNPKFGSPIGVVLMVIAGLSIVFSVVTMVIVVLYRHAQVIKASSPLFCCLELAGFILLYVSTILGLDIPGPGVCVARPLTLNIGFMLVVSNIVAKNFRVYRIFHNIYVTKRVIRDSHLLKIVGTIMFVNIAIMAIWFSKTPPTLQQVTMGDLTTYFTCNVQSGTGTPFFAVLFTYNVALLLVATYLAYKNRNVAANYNECRQIAFVVYNILLSGCIALPTLFLPQDQYFTSFFLSNIVLLFGTTVSLMFMFLPKLWKLFSQIERTNQQNRADTSDDRSIDSFLHNRVGGGWLSNAEGSTAGQSYSGGRKGSVGSLDDKGDTLKESHMGYMGVKFQNRYAPFLSSWCMRRVILYPADKYFTCFELGKPESGRTYSYVAVSIHSREPDRYILSVIGRGRLNFLLQVKDEDRLLHWFALFDNKYGSNYSRSNCHSKTNSNVQKSNVSNLDSKCSYLNETTMMPMSHLPMGLLQTRSESNETLHAALHGFHQMAPHPLTRNNSSPSSSSTGGRSEKGSPRRGDSDYTGSNNMASVNVDNLNTLSNLHPKPENNFTYGTAGFRMKAELLDSVIFRTGILASLRSKKLDGKVIGVMITASHNPAADNGVKVVDPLGEMMEGAWEAHATALANAPSNEHLIDAIHSMVSILKIDLTKPANVVFGRDTRPSGEALVAALVDGLKVLGAQSTDYGILTTPQLHYITRCLNTAGTPEAYGEPSAEGYYKKLAAAFKVLVEGKPKLSPLVLDCANGVGAPKFKEILPYLGDSFAVKIVNDDVEDASKLNLNSGADFVKTQQRAPIGLKTAAGERYASFDGDADRIVYYYQDEDNTFKLLDGDKIAGLAAMYIIDLVKSAGIDDISVGVVQTAYANGASTEYLRNTLNVPVSCVSTGVKHLHHEALKYDVGVYFEANGHGTVLFSPSALKTIYAAEGSSPAQAVAIRSLRALSEVINQTVGDAFSDLFLVETILTQRQWTPKVWDQAYTDLPNRLVKVVVQDRSIFKTVDAERKLTEPAGLQDAIDAIVNKFSHGRSFVRPSGTEDVVRVYAEAATRPETDELAFRIGGLVFDYNSCGSGVRPREFI